MELKRIILKYFPWIKKVYHEIEALKNYIFALASCRKSNRISKEYSKEKIQQIKGKYGGKRCFIIGAGPSLCIDDVEKLKNELTFGVNADFMLYDKTKWRADFYAMIDDTCLKKYETCIDETDIEAFFYGTWSNYHGEKGICLPVHNANNHVIFSVWNKFFPRLFPVAKFSDDISKVVFTGKSVVYMLLQVAAYMGFEEIYLLGVDCNYSQENMYNKDINHKDSYSKEYKVLNGNMMIPQYEVAQKWAVKNKVKIYNATRGGMLEAFPRVDLDDILR